MQIHRGHHNRHAHQREHNVDRLEEQVIRHRVDAPGIRHDAAHQIAHEITCVKYHRAPLDHREQVACEIVNHALPDVDPAKGKDQVEETIKHKNQQTRRDHPCQKSMGAPGARQDCY